MNYASQIFESLLFIKTHTYAYGSSCCRKLTYTIRQEISTKKNSFNLGLSSRIARASTHDRL